MRRKHQQLCFHNSSIAQRHVYRHLVTVKVGVERRTYERMQLYSFTFDQFWLECLYRQTVKRWGTVEQDRMTFQNILKDIPNHRFLTLNKLLGALYRFNDTALNKLAD